MKRDNGNLVRCCCGMGCWCDPAPSFITFTMGANPHLTGGCCPDWINSFVMDKINNPTPPTMGFPIGCACYELTEGLPCGCKSMLGCIFTTDQTTHTGDVGIIIYFDFGGGTFMELTFYSSDNLGTLSPFFTIPPGPCDPSRVPYTSGSFYAYGYAGNYDCNSAFAIGAAIPSNDYITISVTF